MAKRMVELNTLLLAHVQTPEDTTENLRLMSAIAGLNLNRKPRPVRNQKTFGLQIEVIQLGIVGDVDAWL